MYLQIVKKWKKINKNIAADVISFFSPVSTSDKTCEELKKNKNKG